MQTSSHTVPNRDRLQAVMECVMRAREHRKFPGTLLRCRESRMESIEVAGPRRLQSADRLQNTGARLHYTNILHDGIYGV